MDNSNTKCFKERKIEDNIVVNDHRKRAVKMEFRRYTLLSLVAVIFLTSLRGANATSHAWAVGASGDNGSIGSIGVRAEIRTHLYQVSQPDADYFWVGNYHDDGVLIKFGYVIYAPATLCPYEVQDSNVTCIGSKLTVNGSEPLWFWEYIISENHYYSGIGRYSSIGLNGTWHLYSIVPNSAAWEFQIDGHNVATANFPPTNSSHEAEFVADKGSYSSLPGPLGPVEFRNLAYLKQDGWHGVNSLTAIVACGSNCASYGVALVGPNHIIAGTSITQPNGGTLLWSSNPQESTLLDYSTKLVWIGLGTVIAVLITIVVLRARKSKS